VLGFHRVDHGRVVWPGDLLAQRRPQRGVLGGVVDVQQVGTGTFFSYFASKEDILFPDSDTRTQTTIQAIANRDPAEGPVDVLVRALETVAGTDAGMVSPMATVRMRLFRTVPAVRGKALQVQMAAQQQIAREPHAAFPTSWTGSAPRPWPEPSLEQSAVHSSR
jgi:AcrR family transcriptional regulator